MLYYKCWLWQMNIESMHEVVLIYGRDWPNLLCDERFWNVLNHSVLATCAGVQLRRTVRRGWECVLMRESCLIRWNRVWPGVWEPLWVQPQQEPFQFPSSFRVCVQGLDLAVIDFYTSPPVYWKIIGMIHAALQCLMDKLDYRTQRFECFSILQTSCGINMLRNVTQGW